jgi:hypothetical protein
MNPAIPKQIMCAVFDGEDGAEEALELLQSTIDEEDLTIDAMSVLCMDEDEVISVAESQGDDPYWCGVLAALMGLMVGPIIALQDSDEGLIAWIEDEAGLSRDAVDELVGTLRTETSVILAIADADIGDMLEEVLEESVDEILWFEFETDLVDEDEL